MSFGRKGMADATRLTPGQAMALRAMPAPETQVQTQAQAPASTMSPELAAFLAAERANGAAQPDTSDAGMDLPRGAGSGTGTNMGSHTTVIVQRNERLMILAYVLWWFAAPLGAHRHYLGAHASGFAQMGLWITAIVLMFGGAVALSGPAVVISFAALGAACIWFIVDAFLIPGMLRRFNERPNATTFA